MLRREPSHDIANRLSLQGLGLRPTTHFPRLKLSAPASSSLRVISSLEGSACGAQPLQVLDHLLLHLLAADATLQAAAHSGDLISGGSMRIKYEGAITIRQATNYQLTGVV